MRFQPGQHIHLVGIGGFGISAIARILLEQGYSISGSDLNSNQFTEALARDGATIYSGHAADHVNGADMVIVTSAVKDDHVEVKAAHDQNIPVYKRNDIIADLMEDKIVIAVAGTHGKTTTTAMIVHILRECGQDPSYIVGGVMKNTGTNAGVGKGPMFVIEADEYDNMFLGLKPNVIVLTNIEFDHPDFFKTEEELLESFKKFVRLLEPPSSKIIEKAGKLSSSFIFCNDSPLAREAAHHKIEGSVRGDYYNLMGYGLDTTHHPGYWANNISVDTEGRTTFDFLIGPRVISTIRLNAIGKHNVQNAIGALLASDILNPSKSECTLSALETFEGTGRRFEIRGEADDVIVIDDYAHHPTAIKTTLEGAKARYPNHELWAVWQPHTFSRTESLLDQFATAFGSADHVVVTDIYKSRETLTPDSINGQQAANTIQHEQVQFTGSLDDTADYLFEVIKGPAVILIMSAGDAPQIGEQFLALRGEEYDD